MTHHIVKLLRLTDCPPIQIICFYPQSFAYSYLTCSETNMSLLKLFENNLHACVPAHTRVYLESHDDPLGHMTCRSRPPPPPSRRPSNVASVLQSRGLSLFIGFDSSEALIVDAFIMQVNFNMSASFYFDYSCFGIINGFHKWCLFPSGMNHPAAHGCN